MNGSPDSPSNSKVTSKLEKVKGVLSIQEIKIWSISRGKNILTAKVMVSKSSNSLLEKLQSRAKKLGFLHSTI